MYGKPMIVGTGTCKQVFFDDHCKPNEDCILDVWDVDSREQIPFDEHFEKFTFEADPIQAILNEEFFIDCVNSALETQH